MTWKPTEDEIDRGAAALRQVSQGAFRLIPWERVEEQKKQKWREKAEAVLCAAIIVIAKAEGR